MKKTRRTCLYRSVTTLLLIVSIVGCLEASFELAPESRLPKWFDIPEGLDRSDLNVTMDYYSTFSGGEYVIKLYDRNKILNIKKISVSIEDQPTVTTKELTSPPSGFPKGYPAYNVVTVDGITDIIERRKMEPIFYMTDDTAVWQELGAKQE